MSHPNVHIPLSGQVRDHKRIALAALLALIATGAVFLVLALGGGDDAVSTTAVGEAPALRTDGGPNESATAAATSGTLAPVTHDESAVAAAVGSGTGTPSERATGGASESRTAIAVSGPSSQSQESGSSESRSAVAVSSGR